MKISISTRILPDWHGELKNMTIATGQTQSEILEEAIGLYLKKSKRLKVTSRIELLEKRVSTIAGLIAQ